MKIELDENLPSRLVQALTALGHDVDTVHQEGLTGWRDEALWKAAQAAGRFLITQDLDFSDSRRYAPGSHHGLLLVRLRNPGRQALFEHISCLFRDEDTSTWSGSFIVSTDRKLRIKRSGP